MSRKLSLRHNELIGLLARTIASYDPALWGGKGGCLQHFTLWLSGPSGAGLEAGETSGGV
jgi:hypothetical protein